MKYIAVIISGALAGLGGVFLVFIAGIYREGQTDGRGFIGLAALIFGNWRPGGLAAGAGLFGFADAPAAAQPHGGRRAAAAGRGPAGRGRGLAGACAGSCVQAVARRRRSPAAALRRLPDRSTSCPPGIVSFTPHLTTLLVLSLASQRLRMPQADGLVYRRGEH